MPVPTESGSDGSSLKQSSPGVEIILMLESESVPYLTEHLRVDEGSFLAAENAGTRRTHNVSKTS